MRAERRSLLGFIAGVVVLLLWLAGRFAPKVPATETAAAQSQKSRFEGRLVSVRLVPTAPVRIGRGDDSCGA